MNNTYISSNLLGWWGSEDMRVRCIKDEKEARRLFQKENYANPKLKQINEDRKAKAQQRLEEHNNSERE